MDLSKTNKDEFELDITFFSGKERLLFLRLEMQCPWWEDWSTNQ